MKHIKFLFTVLLVGSITMVAYSQRHHKGHKMHIYEQLDLTDKQKEQLKALKTEMRKQMEIIRSDESLSREQQKEKVKALLDEQKTQKDAIFTEEQKAKLEELHKDRRAKHALKKVKRSEMMKKRKAKMLELRKEFDPQIEEDDRARLAELRTILKEGKPNIKDQDLSKEKRKELKKAYKEKYEAELNEVKKLNEKYEEKIKAFMKEKVGDREEMRKERKEKMKAEGKARKMKRKGGKKSHRKHKGKQSFLLLDPGAEAKVLAPAKSQIDVFPNPAQNTTRMEYEVQNDGRVIIQVTDSNGNVVKNILDRTVEKGKHTIDIDVSELQNSSYYIIVTDGAGKTSKQLIKMN